MLRTLFKKPHHKIAIGIILVSIAIGVYLIFSDLLYNDNERKTQLNDIFKVGAILSLSGDLSQVGTEMRRGMEMEFKEYAPNLQIIFEDDQSLTDVKTSIAALQKLITIDQVKLVFLTGMPAMKAIAPILSQYKTPGISLWDSNAEIDNMGTYVYSIGFSNESSGAIMAEYAYHNLKIKHTAVISAHDDWSEIVSNAFIQKFSSLGGSIAIRERIDLNENDVKTVLKKTITQKVDAIYFPLYLNSIHTLIRQSRELGFEGILLTADGFTESDVIKLGKLAEGIYSTQPLLHDEKLRARYSRYYGVKNLPTNFSFVGLGVDAVRMTLNIMEELNRQNLMYTKENVSNVLSSLSYEGVTGLITFANDSHQSRKIEPITIVKNSKFVKVSE